ncbi:diguanylate cyclase [Candidatus Saccharibacteria bacterium]|nr:diguanylate cyclase [Candidatus Saccharibacteria bacterium]
MGKTNHKPRSFYDPSKTYDDNFDSGPSQVFPDEKVYKNRGAPKFSFLGRPLYLPFGIAAGPLPNSQYVKYAFERGFDAVCYKTQRSVAFKVNDFPNVLYVDVDGDLTLEKAKKPLVGKSQTTKPLKQLSITNSFGNPSRGPAFWLPDTKKALSYQGRGQLLISSVVGTIKAGFSGEDYFNDFAKAAKLAASTGVEAIEINLSCPNVASEGILCYTYDSVVSIVGKVKKVIGDLPLIVKLGYYSADQNQLLARIVKAIAPSTAAISTINTIPAPVVDENGNQALPGKGRLMSGICGASVKWAGLEMVKKLDGLRKKQGYSFEIIGIGGVMSPKDFHDYRQAGADLVQSCTGAMWNPNLAAEIKATL